MLSALALWPATRNGARFRVPCLVIGPRLAESVTGDVGDREVSASEVSASEEASSWAPSEPVREELMASSNAARLCDLKCWHLTACLRI